MKKILVSLMLFLTFSVAFQGCGGNGGSDSSTTNPAVPGPSDSWRTMAQNPLWDSTFHPTDFSIVWTGSEMILWGYLTGTQVLMTGAIYDPFSDTWSAISTVNAPGPGPAIWTGDEMIVCSYDTRRYSPTTDQWRITSDANKPNITIGNAVWTGTEMIVLGSPGFNLTGGGKYSPSTDTWSTISTPPIIGETAVWTGTDMIVWTGNIAASGASYDPATDTWTGLTDVNAPSSRFNHVTVWTGDEMIVWGGQIQLSSYILPVQSGRRYNIATDFWSFMDETGSIWAMDGHAVVWTGEEMIIWTGNGGAAYTPGTDTWRSISSVNAPAASGPGIWTGTEMIVWDGESGGRYTP